MIAWTPLPPMWRLCEIDGIDTLRIDTSSRVIKPPAKRTANDLHGEGEGASSRGGVLGFRVIGNDSRRAAAKRAKGAESDESPHDALARALHTAAARSGKAYLSVLLWANLER